MRADAHDESIFGAPRPAREYDHGRAPLIYGIGWFSAVLLAAYGLWLVDFQVDESVQKAIAYPAALAFLIYLIRSTPSSRLAPDVRARRYARRFGGLIGGMVAMVLLGTFVAAFKLNTWGDWVILGVFALLPVGVGIMLNTRFTIGKY